MAEEPDGEAGCLRVAIQGGGCSGFQYGLGFDRGAVEGDIESDQHGVHVVVDPFSAPYLQGATVDFIDGLQESGFGIENPNAVASCGCGHSFQVADEEAPEGAIRTATAAAPAAATDGLLARRLRTGRSASPSSARARPASTPHARC